MMTSASCSMAPDSRRSLIIGRLSVRALDAAVQLRQRDHRALQLLGQRLQAARDLADLGGAVLVAAAGAAHQLQVVDDDQPQRAAELARHAPRARAQLGRVQRRRLVDEHLHLAQRSTASARRSHSSFVQPAGAQVLLVDAAQRADHAQRQLRGAHFHREHQHRQAFVAPPRARRCSARRRSCPSTGARPARSGRPSAARRSCGPCRRSRCARRSRPRRRFRPAR